MKLTPHEQKILNIISENPKIINNPALRSKVANRYGLTEKTLRNRIAELKTVSYTHLTLPTTSSV